MRESIKKQLLALELAQIEYYDTAEHYYFIPKYQGPNYQLNKMYLVQVNLEAMSSQEDVPKQEYLKAYVSQKSDTKIYIDAVGCNPITKQDLNYF